MLQTTTERLTTRLREATAAAHDDAENSGFMSALLDGELHACAAADLAGQLWFVYGALEDAVRSIADTPEGAAIADERLERHDALERYYVDAMDYGRLNAIKQEFLSELPEA